MTEHYLLSPSSAHRWLVCPGSVELGRDADDKPSAAAEEGTAAHELLRETLLMLPPKKGAEYDDDMRSAVETVVEYVRSRKAKWIKSELFVSLAYLGIPEMSGGTADIVLIDQDGILEIVDFKYGAGVYVEAKGNPQLLMYALGAATSPLLPEGYSPQAVRLTIAQPRHYGAAKIRSEGLSLAELQMWGGTVLLPGARAALDEWGGAKALIASESGCRFCPARSECPELYRLAADAFDDAMSLEKPSTEQKAKVFDNSSIIRGFLQAVGEEVEASILSGESDYASVAKIVRKAGRRKWKPGAVDALFAHVANKPTKLSDVFQPAALAKVRKHIHKDDFEELTEVGKDGYSVVPHRDRRKAVTLSEDFEGINETTETTETREPCE